MDSDYDLLDRWAQGDRTAASMLFARYFDTLYVFFRTKTSYDVDDLVQSTFEASLAGRARFRGESTFRTYLLATARYKLFEHYRARRRVDNVSEAADSRLVDLDPTPSTVVAARQEERLLLEALRRLPLDHQIVLELYAWEKYTGPEVAGVLGISEPAMRSRLHRAKLQLRTEMERLSNSPEALESTMANLEEWARRLRALHTKAP
jgi:RNA polymerase sigma-70 factor (ECF subfamily)